MIDIRKYLASYRELHIELLSVREFKQDEFGKEIWLDHRENLHVPDKGRELTAGHFVQQQSFHAVTGANLKAVRGRILKSLK